MANKGSCGKRWPWIRSELEKNLGPLAAGDVVMTNAPNHATVVAREAVGAGYNRLVSVGGAGTLNEGLNGGIADYRLIAPDLGRGQMPSWASNEVGRSFGQL